MCNFTISKEHHDRSVVDQYHAPEHSQHRAEPQSIPRKEHADSALESSEKAVAETFIEMSQSLGVSNRTIINWSAALSKVGLLEPQLVKQRIRSYRRL